MGIKIDHLLDDEPISDRHVAAWLEQAQAAHNISEMTLMPSAIDTKISSFEEEEKPAVENVWQKRWASRGRRERQRERERERESEAETERKRDREIER